ncbi:S41 family peptidase [Lewinella sp. 4G2]|uniref:S41 family peptidase n=1 Tax=Lewinella sp. 4G2 TaxID=1803372 RepID=UPI0007B4E876|nr:S41 family peptidase [Lewinella sp. 4G2]OAV44362.1 peptidase S41 [Lewinella sp. 4G2]
MRFTLLLLALLFSTCVSAQNSPIFADDPALSPDGSTLFFAYNGDLWTVPTNGGNARQITSLEGAESHPKVSPDGKWLAFSSAQKGNADVYIMPLAGGPIRQLTYHTANDEIANWSWDSERIYFTSNRYNRITTFTVDVTGGTPKRLFDNYFNIIHNVAEEANTGHLYFNESWESSLFTHRKGYKGPYNPEIKSFDRERKSVSVHTTWEGKDMWPMTDRAGKVYFVSDRDNGEYNLYRLDGKKAKRLTKFSTSVMAPSMAANGQQIAFIKDYQIHIYDTASGKTTKPNITVSSYAGLGQPADFTTHRNISDFDVALDGKKLAFIARGELFVSDIAGKFVRQLPAGDGRATEVKWLRGDSTLIYTMTEGGYTNLFTIDATGKGSPVARTTDQRNNRGLQIAGDTTRLIYQSGRDEIRLMNLQNFATETLVQDEIWGFQNSLPRWSPDGRYVMYTAYRNFEQDIFLIDTKNNNRKLAVTNTGVSENVPVWSPDGKYIYFTSSRHQPNYPRGGGDERLFRLPLLRFDAPFRQEKFDELFAGDKKEKSDSVEVKIDLTNIMERLEPVGPRAGSQSDPYVVMDGEKTMVFYGSDHAGKRSFYVTTFEPFEAPKTKEIEGSGVGGANDLVEVKGKYYLLGRGQIQSINVGQGKLKPITIKHAFRRSLAPEFAQMFYETWANMEENFYNEDFHGTDWAALRDAYARYLPHLTNRADLRRLTNDLLGELNTSHFGFNSNGSEEQTQVDLTTVALGLAFDQDDPYRVASIIADGPADRAGLDIKAGDKLVAINGTPVDESMNREFYLALPSRDQEVALSLVRGNGQAKTVRLHPVSYPTERNHRYDEWVDDNQGRVDRKTDKKVAYVHMKNMGGSQLDAFLDEMVSESYQRDGLILDLRYNTGGNVHDAVLQFLSQRPYATWKYRGGAAATQPNFAPQAKPIVLLINEQSLSDAEVTTEGFKQLGLGTVVGTPTYRWIIFTSGKGLVDGSYYRLPSWGVYGLDGRNLEKTGVEPDIRIDNTAADRQLGRDPQLDKAIEVVLKELGR